MLSAVGLGCWQFGGGAYWGPCEQRDADAVVGRALDLGINYVDTAEAYNDGRSEASLGVALKGRRRDAVLVGSKVSPSNCYTKTLAAHCEQSLQRLGLDWIDIYMIHWPIHPHSIAHFTDDERIVRQPPALEEAVAALHRLKSEGKIRHFGVSNFGRTRLEEALRVAPDVIVDQVPYSLLMRAAELEILPRCRELGVGVISYMTLMQGVLGDRYANLSEVPPYQRRTRHFDASRSALTRHGGEGAEDETQAALDAVRKIARTAGLMSADVAVKYALARAGIACCLIGARSVERLEQNVRAAAEPLSPDLLAELDRVTRPLLDKLGPSFDYYESVANDRTR
jgi:aryl-alcohol dehydrogenase-like predicted oxidoreductase